MSKVIKIGIIFFILIFTVCITNIYALNMDIDNTTPDSPDTNQNITDNPTDTANEIDTNIVNNDDSLNIQDGLTDNGDITEGDDESLSPTITTNPSSLPESNLGLTNVLNILLIVVGFVLILLGVAIILRLRR